MTCANYDVTIVRLAPIKILAPIMMLQLSDSPQLRFAVAILAPIIIWQLSNLRQSWFFSWHACADYDFTICKIWANYNFTKVIVAPVMILQLSDFCQIIFYNCHIYSFTIVILEPITFYICHTCPKCDLQLLTLRQ